MDDGDDGSPDTYDSAGYDDGGIRMEMLEMKGMVGGGGGAGGGSDDDDGVGDDSGGDNGACWGRCW